jgi:diguanylate cyclase (GGDEF)-like protein
MHKVLGKLIASPLFAAIMAAGVTGSAAYHIDALENQSFRLQQRSLVQGRLAAVRAELEQVLNQHLGAVTSVEALIQANPQVGQQAFSVMADTLGHDLPAVLQIQLAPDAVVRLVYPLADSQKILGLDLRALPGQKEVVEDTIRSGKLRLAGPNRLQQGGTGLIARKPVFVEEHGVRRFWGFVTLILDYDKLISFVNKQLNDHEVAFALRGKDGLGQSGQIFYGDPSLFASEALTAPVTLPNGEWLVAAKPRSDWIEARPNSNSFRILSIALILGVSWLALLTRQRGLALKALATTDYLTSACNRREFVKRAELEMQRSVRHGTPLSVLMLDIDHFKRINDSQGHAGGDTVLVGLTKLIHGKLRGSDLLARIGGEEFAILLPDTTLDGATALAERVRQAVQEQQVPLKDGTLSYTVSIGVTQRRGEENQFEKVLATADAALYQAKNSGRNRVIRG